MACQAMPSQEVTPKGQRPSAVKYIKGLAGKSTKTSAFMSSYHLIKESAYLRRNYHLNTLLSPADHYDPADEFAAGVDGGGLDVMPVGVVDRGTKSLAAGVRNKGGADDVGKVLGSGGTVAMDPGVDEGAVNELLRVAVAEGMANAGVPVTLTALGEPISMAQRAVLNLIAAAGCNSQALHWLLLAAVILSNPSYAQTCQL